MKRCVKCLMPETKPGIFFNDLGWCQACVNHDSRKHVNWSDRYQLLVDLCNTHRSKNGEYDMILTASGGKDSHFQLHTFVKKLGMNPLVVSVSDPFTHTQAGSWNFANIQRAFNADTIQLHLGHDTVRKCLRAAFEHFGKTTWAIDQAIYAWPMQIAIKHKIKLIVYGENVAFEYGGVQHQETMSALDQINNTVSTQMPFSFWEKHGLSRREFNSLQHPTASELKRAGVEAVYLSFFTPWDGLKNVAVAKKYGFKTLAGEWTRDGFIDDYDQIDSMAYLMNVWLKYPKLGFARVTDVVGYWIRSGKITTEQGRKLIAAHDHKLDRGILNDFLNFSGYTEKQFWKIADRWYNEKLFKKVGGKWTPIQPLI